MAVKLETDLYPPVKAFFTRRGYEVKAEVRGCDLVAVRPGEDEPVIVELKKTFTLPLLLQGVDRQRIGADVWLAVERNRAKKGAHNQRFAALAALCGRLGLGLMTVTFYKTKEPVIEVWREPGASARAYALQSGAASGLPAPGAEGGGTAGGAAADGAGATVGGAAAIAAGAAPDGAAAVRVAEAAFAAGYAASAGGRKRAGAKPLLKEFAGRSGDYNVGGSLRRKLVTAYRERAIQCALALVCRGRLAPRQVRDLTGCANAAQVLRDNHYGWFRKPERGVYELTREGEAGLRQFGAVTAAWAGKFAWAAEWRTAQAAEAEAGTPADPAGEAAGGKEGSPAN